MAGSSKRSGKSFHSAPEPRPAAQVVAIANRQRSRKVDIPLLRRVIAHTLTTLGRTHYELGFHLVDAAEMARVNQQFLQHEGSTDVITFDYSADGSAGVSLGGEIYISIPDAIKQAAEFGTTWQSELARYAIHGILHLCGYDDLEAAKRREMKRIENRLVRAAEKQFDLRKLDRATGVNP